DPSGSVSTKERPSSPKSHSKKCTSTAGKPPEPDATITQLHANSTKAEIRIWSAHRQSQALSATSAAGPCRGSGFHCCQGPWKIEDDRRQRVAHDDAYQAHAGRGFHRGLPPAVGGGADPVAASIPQGPQQLAVELWRRRRGRKRCA